MKKQKRFIRIQRAKSLKDGAILLNLGRGGIINETELAKILDEKRYLLWS